MVRVRLRRSRIAVGRDAWSFDRALRIHTEDAEVEQRLYHRLRLHIVTRRAVRHVKLAVLQHEPWARQVKQLRNVVAHEGTTDQFVPVSHEGLLVHDAEVADVRAGEFAVRTWKSVKDLTREVAMAFERMTEQGGIP